MKFLKLVFSIFMLVQISSCLYISTKQKITIDEKVALKVQFDSPQSARIFYNKIKIPNLDKYRGDHIEKTSIMIPFIAFVHHRNFHKTSYYNEKIINADRNVDGVITFKEVKNFKSSIYLKPKSKNKASKSIDDDFKCVKSGSNWTCE